MLLGSAERARPPAAVMPTEAGRAARSTRSAGGSPWRSSEETMPSSLGGELFHASGGRAPRAPPRRRGPFTEAPEAAPLSGSRIAFMALALVLAGPPARAATVQIDVSWDKDLAFDYDRENYQRRLEELVARSYEFVAGELGLALERPLKIVVYAPAHYEKQFGTEAWATQGAHYLASAIYVNGGNRLNDSFSGLLTHEMTHALLDHRGTIRQLPLWLNEGLAERLSYQHRGQSGLAPNQVAELQYGGRQRTLTPLPTWGRARWSYLQCFAAEQFLEEKAGRAKVLAVVRRALQGEPFEHALDEELRLTPADLDREFMAWVEHLSP